MEAVLIPAREILFAVVVFSGMTGDPRINVSEPWVGTDVTQCRMIANLMRRQPVNGQVWVDARCRKSVGV